VKSAGKEAATPRRKEKGDENVRALVLPTARIRRIIKSEPGFCILGGDAVALISKSTVIRPRALVPFVRIQRAALLRRKCFCRSSWAWRVTPPSPTDARPSNTTICVSGGVFGPGAPASPPSAAAQVRDRERLEFLLDIIPQKTTKRKHLRQRDGSIKKSKLD
jgi:hypothetical protein